MTSHPPTAMAEPIPDADAAAPAADVAEWIREQIRIGEVAPGQRLIEIEIIRATGAPRARVRSALQRLEAEGLVVIEEFRGASVRRFSTADVRHIYRIRQGLEGIAAYDFAAADDSAAKAELAEIQATMDRSGADHVAFARLNDAWHDRIVRGGGNPHLIVAVERLMVPIHRLLLASFVVGERVRTANADHQRITAAILVGEAYAAEQLMRSHIGAGLQTMLASIEARERKRPV